MTPSIFKSPTYSGSVVSSIILLPFFKIIDGLLQVVVLGVAHIIFPIARLGLIQPQEEQDQ